ncbi:adenosine 3'-phospho 5'-phosphosulfate transporter 1 [Culicoides brevitarsis]|uniref:adenosine 3'-phospho 5'-phosphosulfate transporter 1 n=1 Tax=Culicoides brevitarsis TaxID=469753 RepID=UPI00307C0264
MRNIVPDFIICSIVLITFLLAHLLSYIIFELINTDSEEPNFNKLLIDQQGDFAFVIRLFVNCLGYACIFIPLLLIYKYIKKTKYLERKESGLLYSLVKLCYYGEKQDRSQIKDAATSITQECLTFLYCFLGLMISFLIWGVLQEKIMTIEYTGKDGKTKSRFNDSQFIVFINRTLAFLISSIYLFIKGHSLHTAPLFKFSYASFSNIMSAWCQYEALKFVNFPTQVLVKSAKVIPVMIMGKVISRAKYEFHEYLTAVMISCGMVLFLTGSADESKHSPSTTLTGLFLLTLYLIFDSFTANWQNHISKTYSMTSIQLMFGVNLFSMMFTSTSLIIQGTFFQSVGFVKEHPKFMIDCITLSLCATTGQLFIYYTLLKFGPMVFTIIMSLRQAIAILLSCLIYKHRITISGVIGIVIVFMAVSIRFYGGYRLRQIRQKADLLKLNYKSRSEV